MKLLWCVLLISSGAFAQSYADPVEDAKSREYSNVAGNPFLFKDWNAGVVKFSSGRVVSQFKLKFDCVRNQLLLQFNGTSFAAESKIREFVMYPKGQKVADSMVFRRGFPAIGNGNAETFYQVLTEGKVTLLRRYAKNIVEEKQHVASNITRHFEDEENYFILRDGILTQADKNNGGILVLLNDKAEDLKKYISDEKLKMRTPEDHAKLVKKYNELIQ